MLVELNGLTDKRVCGGSELACLEGCLFRLAGYKLRKKHFLNKIVKRPDGHRYWVGPLQQFVYCIGCGSRRFLKTFEPVKL
jgi:hypothetical protein